MKRLVRALTAATLAFLIAQVADTAAGAAWSDALAGRAKRMKETHAVRVGYRENVVPFSYLGPQGTPVGYSLDLCQAIVDTLSEDLAETLRIEYVRVTAADRIDRVASGEVDLECGSTTSTVERRSRVAFSPMIFVTGTRLAVLSQSGIRDVDDLRGKSVAVLRGTTNEAAMRELDRLRGLGLRFIDVDDYREGLAALGQRRADALAADEILLRGLIAEAPTAGRFRVVGEMLSFEPYGIMYPRDDPTLADAVDRTFRSLAESREIAWIYERWFVRPLPSGRTIGLPMSDQLRRSFELIGLPAD